jgi:hypothetical protein
LPPALQQLRLRLRWMLGHAAEPDGFDVVLHVRAARVDGGSETHDAHDDDGAIASIPAHRAVLAAASGRPTHLVEADQRKCAFLAEAARTLGLADVKIHAQRIEAMALPPAAIVTARALAPLAVLVGHAHRFLAPEGIAVFPKGRLAEGELTAALPAWKMRVERFPSLTDPAATIFRLSAICPTGAP